MGDTVVSAHAREANSERLTASQTVIPKFLRDAMLTVLRLSCLSVLMTNRVVDLFRWCVTLIFMCTRLYGLPLGSPRTQGYHTTVMGQ